nr:PREDICTED: vomeronasal type-1 receptor 4 [Camelus bactrianus]
MASLGLKLFLSDAGCKVIFYVHKVGRGVSISTTCLLSVFQAIMISPRSSRWAEHKAKAPKYVGISVSLCWSLNMMLNSTVVLYVTGKLGKKNLTRKRDFGHCYVEFLDEITDSLNTVLVSIPDVFCLGLMLWASSNMVFILHRHKQQVQYIHRTSVSCQSAPETRATQSILVLVSTFVSFYTLSFIFHIYFSVVNHSSFWLVNTSVLTSACFPTVSPFVLMSRDSSALRLCFPWIRIT